MPATKIGGRRVENPVKRREAFNRLIDMNMARKGIRTLGELAAMLGMERTALSKRRSGESRWTYEELCRLFSVLDFSAQDIAVAMGAAA